MRRVMATATANKLNDSQQLVPFHWNKSQRHTQRERYDRIVSTTNGPHDGCCEATTAAMTKQGLDTWQPTRATTTKSEKHCWSTYIPVAFLPLLVVTPSLLSLAKFL